MNAPFLAYPVKPEAKAGFADLDLVRVVRAVTTDEGEAVPAGTLGTVVAVYAGGAACEVEFEAGLATVEIASLTAA